MQSSALNDVRRYASGVSEFVELYFAESFCYKTNYSHNGKIIPGVILRKGKDEVFTLTKDIITERINCESLLSGMNIDIRDTSSSVGIVSFCNNRTGFINPGFGETAANDNGLSVIFNPKAAKTIPENFTFNTKSSVYLVLFSVSGTVMNTKTGLEHPAIDYSFPIVILRSFHRNECAYITASTSEVVIGRFCNDEKSNPVNNESFEKCLSVIDERLSNELAKQKYLLASNFPLIAKQCGLATFRDYADSVALFLEKYFTKYVLLKNLIIEGKTYPGVIVEKGENPFEDTSLPHKRSTEDVRTNTMSGMSFQVFNSLFEDGLYAEALSCSDFRDCPPQCLPVEQLEKALTAASRLLNPTNDEKIVLNSFQREVFYCSTTVEFIKKWKHNGVFADSILEQCCETSIARFDYPDDCALAAKLLNALGYKNALNKRPQKKLCNRRKMTV